MIFHATIKHCPNGSPDLRALSKRKKTKNDLAILHPLVSLVVSEARRYVSMFINVIVVRRNLPDIRKELIPRESDQKIIEVSGIKAVSKFLRIKLLATSIKALKNQSANLTLFR
jgi:S-adenosylmethionine synthetase